jgi:hypothetical protein
MGCGDTLFVGSGGYITCSWVKCPDPGAVSDLLMLHTSPHHKVVIGELGWTIEHPLRERLAGLFDCPLHGFMESRPGPPAVPGTYTVVSTGDDVERWVWRETLPRRITGPVEDGET